ncbi:MAG TPA: hypothetical protein VGY77_12745 [Gemmataceae bacterium]|jgi:hypothetical protein|nr:hypothetical protein [Gemmataceae bacterium]
MTSTKEKNTSQGLGAGTAPYLITCLVSLGTILLVMLQRGAGMAALLPIMAGLIGLGTRFGPIMFLVTLGLALNILPFFGSSYSRPGFIDLPGLLLCGGVLAYVMAHYRFQGLVNHIFPPDPRRREDQPKKRGLFSFQRRPLMKSRRSARSVSSLEILRLIVCLPIFAGLAQVMWIHLPTQGTNPGLRPAIWHAIILTWLFGSLWFIGAGILDYLRFRNMTGEEAALYLQDILWADSRREQRRINRWVAWARLRFRQKETS